jgi:hypothetical protein
MSVQKGTGWLVLFCLNEGGTAEMNRRLSWKSTLSSFFQYVTITWKLSKQIIAYRRRHYSTNSKVPGSILD